MQYFPRKHGGSEIVCRGKMLKPLMRQEAYCSFIFVLAFPIISRIKYDTVESIGRGTWKNFRLGAKGVFSSLSQILLCKKLYWHTVKLSGCLVYNTL